MPTPECLKASNDRVTHAINRLNWQKRLAANAKDSHFRLTAERLVTTLEEIVKSMQDAHALLVRQSQRNRGGK